LAVALLSVPTVAGPVTAQATVDWLPGTVASDQLTGPVLVGGRLTDERGVGFSGYVGAVAWPTSAVLSKLQDGQQVKLLPVGKAVSNADGTFAIRVDPSVPITEYMEPDGIVNLDLRVLSPTNSTAFSVSRRYGSDARGNRVWTDPQAGQEAQKTASPVALSISASASTSAVELAPEATVKDYIGGCPATALATYNQVDDVVGEMYTGPNATGTFTYTTGSTSTLGVGMSFTTGNFGAFSAGGTQSQSSTAVGTYPSQPQNRKTYFQTTFQTKKFKVTCTGGGYTSIYYTVRTTEWQGGGSSYQVTAAPTTTYCSYQQAGMEWTKATANAVTWSNGYKLAAQIGVDLSTSTGYTTKTSVFYHWVNSGYFCGDNASWPNATRVAAK
jgi:hypothetical protein